MADKAMPFTTMVNMERPVNNKVFNKLKSSLPLSAMEKKIKANTPTNKAL